VLNGTKEKASRPTTLKAVALEAVRQRVPSGTKKRVKTLEFDKSSHHARKPDVPLSVSGFQRFPPLRRLQPARESLHGVQAGLDHLRLTRAGAATASQGQESEIKVRILAERGGLGEPPNTQTVKQETDTLAKTTTSTRMARTASSSSTSTRRTRAAKAIQSPGT